MTKFELFIANISHKIDYVTLFELIKQFADVKFIKYRTNIAYVQFFSETDLFLVNKKLKNLYLFGRMVDVQIVESETVLVLENEITEEEFRIISKIGSVKLKVVGEKQQLIFRRKSDAEKVIKLLTE
ncbi:hypothetical protein NUSPORA_01546 [Nucleospora cyclopteri]